LNHPVRMGLPPDPDLDHSASIPLYLLMTILTCGIANLYWNYRQMRSCNALLDRFEFNWTLWLLLCILTCGLYHFYYQFKMGDALNRIQRRYSLPVTEGLPALSLVTAILGFGIMADCVHQHVLNQIDEALRR